MGAKTTRLFVYVGKTFTVVAASTIGILVYLNQVDVLVGGVLGLLALLGVGLAWVMALLVGMLERAAQELSEARDDSLEASRHDLLTGLLNHGAILEEVDQLPSLPGTHAVLMADVDGLKSINDMYGHVTGDQVILTVAACLSQEGALVGRYGGDEFLAILKNSDRPAAESYREKVTSALAEASILDPLTGNRIPIQVSMGIATFPEEASAITDLVSLSDEAMYAVKRQRPESRESNDGKYALSLNRLVSILGAFGPLLSGDGSLGQKMDLLARRLVAGTGFDAIVVTLWGDKGEQPIARAALASTNEELISRANAYFEATDFAAMPIWQQLLRVPRPLIVNDVSKEERFTDTDQELMRSAGVRSALIVPLNGPDGILGALYIASKLANAFATEEVEFFAAIADHLVAIANTALLLDRLKLSGTRVSQVRESTVMRLAAAAEAHSSSVGSHLKRVREVAEAIALELGYNATDAYEVGLAAALHDVGKLYVPETILSKSGVLSADEWQRVREHSTLGAQFLEGPGMELAAQVARAHHERWDGGGYPEGLRGEAIPEAACITAIADSLDAMTHARGYQSRRTIDQALDEVVAQSGKQFSPRVVKAALSWYARGGFRDLVSAEPRDVREAA